MNVIRGYFNDSLDWIQLYADLDGNLAKQDGIYGNHSCKDAELDVQDGTVSIRRAPESIIITCSMCGFQLTHQYEVSGWVSGIFELKTLDLLVDLGCSIFMNVCEFCFGLIHRINICPYCKASGLSSHAKMKSILCKVIDVSEIDGEIKIKTREGALVSPAKGFTSREYFPLMDEIVIRQEEAESSLVNFVSLRSIIESKDPVFVKCYEAYKSGNGVLPLIEAFKARFNNFLSLVNLDELVEALGYAEISKNAGGDVNGNAANTGNSSKGASGSS